MSTSIRRSPMSRGCQRHISCWRGLRPARARRDARLGGGGGGRSAARRFPACRSPRAGGRGRAVERGSADVAFRTGRRWTRLVAAIDSPAPVAPLRRVEICEPRAGSDAAAVSARASPGSATFGSAAKISGDPRGGDARSGRLSAPTTMAEAMRGLGAASVSGPRPGPTSGAAGRAREASGLLLRAPSERDGASGRRSVRSASTHTGRYPRRVEKADRRLGAAPSRPPPSGLGCRRGCVERCSVAAT